MIFKSGKIKGEEILVALKRKKFYLTLFIAVLFITFQNCSVSKMDTISNLDQNPTADSSKDRSSLNEFETNMAFERLPSTPDNKQYLVIIDHWKPAGPEPFVKELLAKLPLGKSHRKLAFSWPIHLLQTSDNSIIAQVKECFRVSQKYNIPFMLHVNHEWLLPHLEIDGYSLAHPDIVEKIDWDGTPMSDWWSDWSVTFTGQPTRFPPRLALNHPRFIQMNQHKANIVKSVIAQYKFYDKFIGIDTGWETAIDYDYKQQLPAYNALMRAGYSKLSPPADLDVALAEIAKTYVEQEVKYYNDLLPNNKLFTHILVVDEAARKRRQPMAAAISSGATPGFSTGLGSGMMTTIKNTIGNQRWAITESWNKQDQAVKSLDGIKIPAGMSPPSLVVLYTWDVDIHKNSYLLGVIRNSLNANLPTPAPAPTPAPPAPAPKVPAPTPAPSPIPATGGDGSVIGFIDGIANLNGVLNIHGWACAKGHESSIVVHAYLGASAVSGGILATHGTADLYSETAVAAVCGTSKTWHRFNLKIQRSVVDQFKNAPIFIHGISPTGKPNNLIGNSGKFFIY